MCLFAMYYNTSNILQHTVLLVIFRKSWKQLLRGIKYSIVMNYYWLNFLCHFLHAHEIMNQFNYFFILQDRNITAEYVFYTVYFDQLKLLPVKNLYVLNYWFSAKWHIVCRWHHIFKSRFLRSIGNMSHIYFRMFLLLLVLFFLGKYKATKDMD